MPSKDQCIDCKHRSAMGDCAINGTYIKYDGVSCINQTKRKKRIFEQPFFLKGELDEQNTGCPLWFMLFMVCF